MTDKQLLANIYTTLNQVEVKGYGNISKIFGILNAIENQLKQEETKKDGE